MNLDDTLGSPVAFGEFVRDPMLLPEWAWLYTRERGLVRFSTMCRATLISSRECSEEEAELRDATLEKEGFACLMSRSQIEDVIANLAQRHPNPSPGQLEEALQFYLEHDAFIVA